MNPILPIRTQHNQLEENQNLFDKKIITSFVPIKMLLGLAEEMLHLN